jgi:hypothetical protein
MNPRLANLISTIGHPLLTIPIFVIVALFSYENFQTASFISALILVGVVIPLTIKMFVGAKKGTYTNFDISDKFQRQSWYILVLVLLFILTIIVFLTKQSLAIRLNTLFFFLLFCIAGISNLYVKTSLHVSLNIFLSSFIMQMNIPVGIAFLGIVTLVA